MRASTETYIELQRLYKERAEQEKAVFKEILGTVAGGQGASVDGETVDSFSKNGHALRVLKGKRWGILDEDRKALGK